MGTAIAVFCFGMVSLGLFSLARPGRYILQDNSELAQKGRRGAGCLAAVVFGPGALFATVQMARRELSPEYYVATVAMFAAVFALWISLGWVADFVGLPTLLEQPAKIVSGGLTIAALSGRSGPRAIARALMEVEADRQVGGYREGIDWQSFAEELEMLARRQKRRHLLFLSLSAGLALLPMAAAINHAWALGSFDPTSLKTFIVLLASVPINLVVGLLCARQLDRAAGALPGAVLRARQAEAHD